MFYGRVFPISLLTNFFLCSGLGYGLQSCMHPHPRNTGEGNGKRGIEKWVGGERRRDSSPLPKCVRGLSGVFTPFHCFYLGRLSEGQASFLVRPSVLNIIYLFSYHYVLHLFRFHLSHVGGSIGSKSISRYVPSARSKSIFTGLAYITYERAETRGVLYVFSTAIYNW
jgi:hypothetical protein